ncbi:alpha/beta superfamily hydrolase/acyltransferase [Mycolicibacterium canariasense]|uniref:Alpha/beta superfamily hydrolase/acyltransferase n=1 Tax=Mycolicibacterium canariasense TaxID=228230 RepID=A0A100WH46_MYCCR|nr:alpha/beta hydrolase [Mycolicibacterium canariasense]MCV7212493.1 alpha/beta hydrolase [Mycolicibacterium canariasense]ORV15457.1 alpha/beta hydrolase [Mycolicibacterium canariasense]GAS97933.1 alpha/beta superfamily hydrolase/acyltransferase [Mycolicibacterium canariasense]
MRKPFRVALNTLGVLVATPVLVLATTAVVHAVASKVEASDIVSYGELVPVDGKKMNVVIRGSGNDTIVLLPGLGTAAPALDFQPLIEALSVRYRVIAVEPFGTGLSDQTDTERTIGNITRELHEALRYLGVDRYVLMGHSMAGIYALAYSAAYAGELSAFVGIDSSVPDQPGWNEPLPADAIVALADLGITRLLRWLGDDPYAGLPYDEATQRQLDLLSAKNAAAPTLTNEMRNAPANFAAVSGMTFPKDLPVLLFVRAQDADIPGWGELHRRQAASVDRGRVITLDGGHYLHHTRSADIARDTATFLEPH